MPRSITSRAVAQVSPPNDTTQGRNLACILRAIAGLYAAHWLLFSYRTAHHKSTHVQPERPMGPAPPRMNPLQHHSLIAPLTRLVKRVLSGCSMRKLLRQEGSGLMDDMRMSMLHAAWGGMGSEEKRGQEMR